jgi:transcriptional regulator
MYSEFMQRYGFFRSPRGGKCVQLLRFRTEVADLSPKPYICRMYIPEHFAIMDPATIRTFLQEHPFGILTVNGDDGVPAVVHLPFLPRFEGDAIFLEGHLAKTNEMAQYLTGSKWARMIVNGAHGYVSSSVYGHVNVPTYNYQAVYLTGTVRVLTNEELLRHLKAVVNSFEQNRERPIDFGNWPVEMIEQNMRGITGFRLTVTKTEAAFKLSQNRNDADFARIVADLQQGNADQIRLAEEMKRSAHYENPFCNRSRFASGSLYFPVRKDGQRCNGRSALCASF